MVEKGALALEEENHNYSIAEILAETAAYVPAAVCFAAEFGEKGMKKKGSYHCCYLERHLYFDLITEMICHANLFAKLEEC